jgi:glucosamine--fructose-6-phosphate aminotransferase (isomerizing)
MELGIKNGEDCKMKNFLAEILEQPQSLKDTLSFYDGNEGRKILSDLCGLVRKENFSRIVFTGMGSSFFVSYAASCLFNSMGIKSCALNTSELLYYHYKLLSPETLLVCISQSGESAEVVKLLGKIPSGITCLGITNEVESTLAVKSKGILLSVAGKEKLTSTKTYTSTTLLSFMFGWAIANQLDENKYDSINQMTAGFEQMLGCHSELVTPVLDFLGDLNFIQFIGRGPLYSTALQSELMFKEAAKTSSSGALGGEFRHGPMEMVDSTFRSVLFAADGVTYSQSIKMASDIAKYDGKVVLLTNKDPQLNNPNIKPFVINQPDEFLFSIQSIVPVQLMVNQLALSRGFEPGDFVHGGKVTLAE